MSHFQFETLDQLARRANKLGAPHVALERDPERVKAILARKQRVGDHTVGNSIAIHPMEGCDAAGDGRPGDLTRRRYERFAAGGAKLIWFESTAVSGEGRSSARQLWLCPETMPDFAKLLDGVRRAHRREFGGAGDLLEVLQLTHSGRFGVPHRVIAAHHPALDRKTGVAADHPLAADDEIEQIEDQYVEAARLAVEAGFHAIDIKACGGSLAHELLSARERAGRYGGPLENRARFLKNVIGKIRDAAGGPLVIAVRLGCYDGIPYEAGPDGVGAPLEHSVPYAYGFGVDTNDPLREDLTEVKQVVGWLEAWDVALLSISVGFGQANPHVGRPYERPAEGDYQQPEHPLLGVDRQFRIAGALQQAYPELPMAGAGYSWLREYMLNAAAANIGQGHIRFFGAGRNAIAYPEFARDALERGALDPGRVCLTDGDCICLMRSETSPLGQFPAGCASRDKRLYGALLKSARKAAKKV